MLVLHDHVKPVKQEFANATTETRAQLDQRDHQENQASTVLPVLMVNQVNLVWLETCPQFRWTPMASATHAHLDQKDQTDRWDLLAQQDQKDHPEKVVHQAQMAKMDLLEILLLDLMANLVALDLRVREALMACEEKQAKPVVKAQLEDLAQQEMLDPLDPLVKLDQQAQPADQADQVKMAISDQEDLQAHQANPVHQAKTPHTAHAPDVIKQIPLVSRFFSRNCSLLFFTILQIYSCSDRTKIQLYSSLE